MMISAKTRFHPSRFIQLLSSHQRSNAWVAPLSLFHNRHRATSGFRNGFMRAGNMFKSKVQLRSTPHDQLVMYALELQNSLKRLQDAQATQGLTAHIPQNPSRLQNQALDVKSDSHENTDANEIENENENGTTKSSKRQKRKAARQEEHQRGDFPTRRIALQIAYLGWQHHGFASQVTQQAAQVSDVDTIEFHLLNALEKTMLVKNRNECEYTRAGRTDTGVSASGQIIGLKVRSSGREKEIDYVSVLNAHLPSSIRVLCWIPVVKTEEQAKQEAEMRAKFGRNQVSLSDASMENRNAASSRDPVADQPEKKRKLEESNENDGRDEIRPMDAVSAVAEQSTIPFHARFDAQWRSYKYYFIKGQLNIEAMKAAAAYLKGRHDYRNFCKIDVDNTKSFERVLYDFEVRPVVHHNQAVRFGEDELFEFYICGQAFLWHQVRCMVAVLFMVGEGKEKPEVAKELLDIKEGSIYANGKPVYRMASALPLVLSHCQYPESSIDAVNSRSCEQKALQKLDNHYTTEYMELITKLAINREFMSILEGFKIDGVLWKELRQPNMLLDTESQRNHIPLEKRARGESLQAKKHKAAARKEEETRGMDQSDQEAAV